MNVPVFFAAVRRIGGVAESPAFFTVRARARETLRRGTHHLTTWGTPNDGVEPRSFSSCAKARDAASTWSFHSPFGNTHASETKVSFHGARTKKRFPASDCPASGRARSSFDPDSGEKRHWKPMSLAAIADTCALPACPGSCGKSWTTS